MSYQPRYIRPMRYNPSRYAHSETEAAFKALAGLFILVALALVAGFFLLDVIAGRDGAVNTTADLTTHRAGYYSGKPRRWHPPKDTTRMNWDDGRHSDFEHDPEIVIQPGTPCIVRYRAGGMTSIRYTRSVVIGASLPPLQVER